MCACYENVLGIRRMVQHVAMIVTAAGLLDALADSVWRSEVHSGNCFHALRQQETEDTCELCGHATNKPTEEYI